MKRLLAVALLATIAACGGGGARDSSRTTLTVQVGGEREETAVYEIVARAYEQQNPTVTVRVTAVAETDDHLAKLATSFASGQPPDLFVLSYRELGPFARDGAITPVESLLRSRVRLDDYHEAPLAAFRQEGRLQCMPNNASSLVVYVNRQAFATAGQSLPRAGWSWDDLLATAAAMAKEGRHGVGVSPQLRRLAPFVWSNGGDVVDDLEHPRRLQLQDPAARTAIDFFLRLTRDATIHPTPAEAKSASLKERFIDGRLAMLFESRRIVPELRERAVDFDVVPVPIAPGGRPATIIHTDGWCVSSGTGDEQQAADFVAFAVSSAGQSMAALSGRVVPVLKSSAAVFLDPGKPPASSRVFIDNLEIARRTPSTARWTEVEDLVDEAIGAAVSSRETTPERLAETLGRQAAARLG